VRWVRQTRWLPRRIFNDRRQDLLSLPATAAGRLQSRRASNYRRGFWYWLRAVCPDKRLVESWQRGPSSWSKIWSEHADCRALQESVPVIPATLSLLDRGHHINHLLSFQSISVPKDYWAFWSKYRGQLIEIILISGFRSGANSSNVEILCIP